MGKRLVPSPLVGGAISLFPNNEEKLNSPTFLLREGITHAILQFGQQWVTLQV